jgi:hypothetical protein
MRHTLTLRAAALVAAGFAALPGAAGQAPGVEEPTTGVRGVVTVQFVPGLPDVEPPPPRPLRGAAVQVFPLKGGKPVAEAKTDEEGRFRVAVGPGEYRVVVVPPAKGVGKPEPVEVKVKEGAFADVKIRLQQLGV